LRRLLVLVLVLRPGGEFAGRNEQREKNHAQDQSTEEERMHGLLNLTDSLRSPQKSAHIPQSGGIAEQVYSVVSMLPASPWMFKI
jgi:hypothetical protein